MTDTVDASGLVPRWRLRAEFALRLAELYGREVPAYTTLVEVTREVNAAVAAQDPARAAHLGSLERVSAERHGAIRVGSPAELAQAARLFAGFGMHPVGFYDLRDASASSVPVVSTAFRPTDADELARNPFRVFTSMLTSDDRRFFDAETEEGLGRFFAARVLFGEEVLQLADASVAGDGLPADQAERFLDLATACFALSNTPIDRGWYRHLEAISAVAADIGGVPATHINHLTPRVLDIDDLYARMEARGITMIDEIQGPPRWAGSDVLLRQTSFKALAETRQFRDADGEVRPGTLRVRFGEVEQRGIALTALGRDRYDAMVAEVDARRAEPRGAGEQRTRAEVAAEVWAEQLPASEAGLAAEGLAFFRYRAITAASAPSSTASVEELVRAGALRTEPIVYEDFLPRSAAGIFSSNLTDAGSRDDAQPGTAYDLGRLSDVIGMPIADPLDLYAAEQQASLDTAAHALGVTLTRSTTLQETAR